jgi:TATA-binding protein-associated factor Taf7
MLQPNTCNGCPQVMEVTAAQIQSSSSSSTSSSMGQGSAGRQDGEAELVGDDDDDDEEEEEEEEEEGAYQDTRCRRVTLAGSSSRTAALLARLRQQLPLCSAPGDAGA